MVPGIVNENNIISGDKPVSVAQTAVVIAW